MRVGAGGAFEAGTKKRKYKLLLCVSIVALTIVASLPRPAASAEYHVTDETGLRQTIQDIADGSINDPNPVIILDNDIDIAATPFPAINQPLTINTNGNTLEGIDTLAGATPGASIAFAPGGGSLTIDGTLQGGDSAPDAGNVQGGTGLAAEGLSITNDGSITGGTGGGHPTNGLSGNGGAGLTLLNGFLVNNNTITGGNAGESATGADGLAGVGVIINGGTAHVNNGTIQAGTTTRVSAGGGQGLQLLNGTLTNNGTILGNGLAANPGANADGVYLTNATIINNSTGLIKGADESGATGIGGDGVTASSGDATVINYGTIKGGSSNNNSIAPYGIVAAAGNTGTLTIVNAGTIEGHGLPPAGNLAISFNSMRGILELQAGSNIVGNVRANAGLTNDILRLGGDEDETFDVSGIGTTVAFKYQNFNIFEKTGASNWTITGVGGGQAANWAILGGTMTMADGSDLGNGVLTITNGTLAGLGTVGQTNSAANGIIAPGINGIGTLTIDGSYTGNGGLLQIETVLGDDASETDLLQINGNSTGSTSVVVTNLGGSGASTEEGIKIVNVDGADSSGSFNLLGDYAVNGEQAVVAGAYAYGLYQGSVSAPGDGDWYLRNILAEDGSALLQAGAPLYESYAGTLQSFNQLGTLQQRVGNRSWAGAMGLEQGADAVVGLTGGEPRNSGLWARIEGADGHFEPETSTSGADYDTRLWRLQAGLDMLISENASGNLIGGVNVFYGLISGDVESLSGSGSIDSDGYGVGGTLTWYANNGFYVDGQAQVTWYESDLSSDTLGALVEENDGTGYGLSIEAGQKFAVAPNWSLTPQAQLAWSSVDFDGFTDDFGADVSLDGSDSLVGRLGITADYEAFGQDSEGRVTRSHVYGIGNLYYDFEDGSTVDVAGVSLDSENEALWGGLGIGGTYNWADDRYSLYGEALAKTGMEDFGDSHVLYGTVGYRMSW